MCNCIREINSKLTKSGINAELDVPFIVDPITKDIRAEIVTISTCKRDESKRGKSVTVTVFASYCPFCGERYEQDANEEEILK